MAGLLAAVFGVFAAIVCLSMGVMHPSVRQVFVGSLSVASLISMFASPLFIMVSSLKAAFYPVPSINPLTPMLACLLLCSFYMVFPEFSGSDKEC